MSLKCDSCQTTANVESCPSEGCDAGICKRGDCVRQHFATAGLSAESLKKWEQMHRRAGRARRLLNGGGRRTAKAGVLP